ncbi:MAG: Tm-1-like ATP-binding domain-containing protein [Pseudomonadota bacterium]
MAQVLILATLVTKSDEACFLKQQMEACSLTAELIDISLPAGNEILHGAAKCKAMSDTAAQVLETVVRATQKETEVVVGIGGGTGGEIVLNILRALPITFPKVLVTTLPFDPRVAVADNSIILVPTLADLSGLNTILREVFENTALMTAGLCQKARKGELTTVTTSIGITALGATDAAVPRLVQAFAEQGRESTVFHSNGYGGAAFARFANHGAFEKIIDLTPHELTRLHIAGVHADMPDRFTAGSNVPRVVLPGAMNFIGLGQIALVPERYLSRPHYEHSGFFTHVKVTSDEMVHICMQLAQNLNALAGPCAVIVPMGGFSHHDRPGGAIEDPALRQVCLDTLKAHLSSDVPVRAINAHLFSDDVTQAILSTLADMSIEGGRNARPD